MHSIRNISPYRN